MRVYNIYIFFFYKKMRLILRASLQIGLSAFPPRNRTPVERVTSRSDSENSLATSSRRSSRKYLPTRHLVYPAHENCRRSRAARAGAITNEIIYRDRGAPSPRRISGRAQPGVINVPEGQENRSPSGTDPYEIKILPPGRTIRLLVLRRSLSLSLSLSLNLFLSLSF